MHGKINVGRNSPLIICLTPLGIINAFAGYQKLMKTRRLLLQNTLASFFCCILAFSFSLAALWKKRTYRWVQMLSLNYRADEYYIVCHCMRSFSTLTIICFTQTVSVQYYGSINKQTSLARFIILPSGQTRNLVVQLMKTPKKNDTEENSS